MSSHERVRRSTRVRCRKPVLDVDLNAVPPCETRGDEGPSNRPRSLHGQSSQGPDATLPAPIDLEAIDDDDVIISSPRAFAEAKNNSRRNQGRAIVVDIESEERPARNKWRRVPADRMIINCDRYINLEGSSKSMKNSGQAAPAPPAPPAPPKEPTFSCPICMGQLVEEMSTKCGHIFCKACIKAALAVQNKCPTCRKKTTTKDIIRVYLPSTGSS